MWVRPPPGALQDLVPIAALNVHGSVESRSFLERSPRGLWRPPAKGIQVTLSWVRIPLAPLSPGMDTRAKGILRNEMKLGWSAHLPL
jgi:hypothetical protein